MGLKWGTRLFKAACLQLLADELDLLVLGVGHEGVHAGRRWLQLRQPSPSVLRIRCAPNTELSRWGGIQDMWDVSRGLLEDTRD